MRGRFLHNFLVLIFTLLINEAVAIEAVNVDEKTENINLSPYSEIFFDSLGRYSYENVSAELFNGNFSAVESNSVSVGYTSDAVWMRFKLHNKSEKDMFCAKLEMPLPWISKLDIYIKTDEALSIKNLGSTLAFETKEISSRSFFVPVIIKPSSSATIYLRAESTNAMALAPKLFSEKQATERMRYMSIYSGILIGAVIIMLFYNLNFYLTLKNDSYLHFTLYLVGLLFFMGTYYGYNVEIFWRESPLFNQKISLVIVAFSFFTGLLFTRKFLNTSENFPKSDTFLAVVMYAFIAVSIFSFIIKSSLIISYVSIFLVVLYSAGLIYISVMSLLKKISGSDYFLAAWLFPAFSLLASSLMLGGFIDYSNFIYDSYGISLMLNILLLSFALASRTKDKQIECELKINKEHEISNKLDFSKNELVELNRKLKRKIELHEKQLLEKETELEKFSVKDNTTGLYNKIKLAEILSKELHRSKRYKHEFSLIIINIDDLKLINQAHGYKVGDSVIKEISNLLLNNIRYIDTVGRWSDDEYLIVAPETNMAQALTAAQHLKQLIEDNKFFFVGSVTISMGVTCSLKDDTEKHIIQRVYEALAKAKENGKNRIETA